MRRCGGDNRVFKVRHLDLTWRLICWWRWRLRLRLHWRLGWRLRWRQSDNRSWGRWVVVGGSSAWTEGDGEVRVHRARVGLGVVLGEVVCIFASVLRTRELAALLSVHVGVGCDCHGDVEALFGLGVVLAFLQTTAELEALVQAWRDDTDIVPHKVHLALGRELGQRRRVVFAMAEVSFESFAKGLHR